MVTARSSVPAIVAAVLLLAGCGEADGLQPTLGEGAPEVEQDGSLVNEFITICGAVVLEGAEPAVAAERLGWDSPPASEMSRMAAMGGYGIRSSDQKSSFEVSTVDFPHLKGKRCSMTAQSPEASEAVDFARFESLPGFQGRLQTVGSGAGLTNLAKFSGVASDGAVVVISATQLETAGFVSLSMSKSKPVAPAE